MDFADKADVAAAASARTQLLQRVYKEALGLEFQQSHTSPQVLLELELANTSAKGLLGCYESLWFILDRIRGDCPGLIEPVDGGLQQAPTVLRDVAAPSTKLPHPITADQLEMRVTVWLATWLLCPHVHEEEGSEVLAGLGEALAATK